VREKREKGREGKRTYENVSEWHMTLCPAQPQRTFPNKKEKSEELPAPPLVAKRVKGVTS
jgi:hypothetical protein